LQNQLLAGVFFKKNAEIELSNRLSENLADEKPGLIRLPFCN